MPYPTKRTNFGDYTFDIKDYVYEPAEDSFLFAENLDVVSGATVLDMGSGCGILGILAAKEASSVIAVDLNPYAIRCAKENSVLNNVHSKMDFLQADLFSALKAEAAFDLIVFNAPYLPSNEGEVETWLEWSWAGGKSGRAVIDRFITEVPSHLSAGGRVLLMQSTLAGVEETISKFGEHNLKASVKAEQKLPFFETLTLIEAKVAP